MKSGKLSKVSWLIETFLQVKGINKSECSQTKEVILIPHEATKERKKQWSDGKVT